MNRRVFLQAGFGALAAGALPPRRVLVAYSSRCGSTQEVAQAVAKDLERRGWAVDLKLAGKSTAVAGYQAVVLGSAVRFGKWLPEAVEFVRAHQAELKNVPTAFFSVHMRNLGSDEASRKARLEYTAPVRALVEPGAEAFFAGKMDMSRLSLGARMMCKVMKARNEDLRDWPRIHAWACDILPESSANAARS